MQIPGDHHQNDSQPTASLDHPTEDRRAPRWWLFPLLLLLALLVALLLKRFGPLSATEFGAGAEGLAPWTPAVQPTGETVGLSIDFGNGARREFDALPWTEGMTVGDVLSAAAEFKPAIRFQHQGRGATAFLTSLEGVANQGAGGRNWLYRVDERHGQVSFVVQQVGPGQRVLWIFGRGE